MTGVLVVDKPPGLTSHDVVAAARRALGERRIGHCGTLDPMATGVLALAIGSSTRLVQFLSGETKHYDAVIRFGLETTTCDITGEVVASSAARPTRDSIEAALTRFRGAFEQTPPAFSAKKVEGVRAHTVARRHAAAGAAPPALRPVPVTCHDLTLTAFDGEEAAVSMVVSAGFYVRSLAHDLGQVLGMGAVLGGLRRTRSGQFTLEDAVPFERLVRDGAAGVADALVPPSALLPEVPAVVLSPDEVRRVRHGRDLPQPAPWTGPPPSLVRLLDQERGLVALAVPGEDPGLLHPSVVLG
jgi:tRNA pseudouridine55 synthase